jgi:putative flavoprotein involved in K+ transport
MAGRDGREYVETLVIGGGQAGLATGYQLSRRDLPYKIIDANERVGDAWRNRWDSLRLFTPNRLNSLPGMPFPGYHWGFRSKNEMACVVDALDLLGIRPRGRRRHRIVLTDTPRVG